MRMSIEPTQITDNYDGARVNMMDSGPGGVGVLVHLWRQPTYLLKRDDSFIYFITFQNQAWADEWFEQNEGYEIVWSFEPEEQS